jgi:ATP/maltotriose-dependent transcriptional regulator MalT
MTGQFEWGAAVLEDALGCPGPSVPDDRAWALGLYGWLLANGPDMTAARAAVDQAKQLLAGAEDPFVEAVVLATWTMVAYFEGDLDAARDAGDDAVAAARASGDGWATAIVELVRGEILQADGSAAEAAAALASAARGFEQVGDDFTLSITLGETADGHEQVGDLDRAADALLEAVAVAERSGSAAHTVALRASLANLEILRGDLDRAEQLHLEVIAALDGQPYQWIRAISWNGLAMIERRRDDPDAAERWLDLAWRLRRTETVPHMRGLVLVARGYTADLRGDAATALSLQRAGLDVHLALGAPRAIAYSLEGVAGALAAGDDDPHHELAARLLGHADALRRSSGGPMPAAERFDVDRAEGRSRARLGDGRFAELHAAGAGAALDVLLADLGALPSD